MNPSPVIISGQSFVRLCESVSYKDEVCDILMQINKQYFIVLSNRDALEMQHQDSEEAAVTCVRSLAQPGHCRYVDKVVRYGGCPVHRRCLPISY